MELRGGSGLGRAVRVISPEPEAGSQPKIVEVQELSPEALHPSSSRQKKGADKESENCGPGRHKEKGGVWWPKSGDGGVSGGPEVGQSQECPQVKEREG